MWGTGWQHVAQIVRVSFGHLGSSAACMMHRATDCILLCALYAHAFAHPIVLPSRTAGGTVDHRANKLPHTATGLTSPPQIPTGPQAKVSLLGSTCTA